jgi:hypothetical protein
MVSRFCNQLVEGHEDDNGVTRYLVSTLSHFCNQPLKGMKMMTVSVALVGVVCVLTAVATIMKLNFFL